MVRQLRALNSPAVDPLSPERSVLSVHRLVKEIAAAGSIPIIVGGDHSLMYPDVVAVTDVHGKGEVGVIHFDAHFDGVPLMFGHYLSHGAPVRRLIDEAHVRCRTLLNDHRDKLDILAARLVEVETIEGDELLALLGPWEGRPLPGELDYGRNTGGSTPPAGGLPAGQAEPEEAPQGRPGIAWGNSNAAQPSE